jgi:DNA-binding MarR family transcriptional regulator
MTLDLAVRYTETGPPTPRSDPLRRARTYWQGEHLGVDEESFITMTSVLRLHRLMSVALEQELKTHGIKLNDYMLLLTLELSEHRTRSISRLARALMIHPTTATLATDRLEARGLLARTPHPSDRRATLVSITDLGRETIQRASAALDALGYGLSGTTSEDRAGLVNSIDRVRAAVGD